MYSSLIDNIFVMLYGRVFQHSRHSYGYQLYSPTHRLVPLFGDRLDTGASQEKRKEASPTPQFHVPLHR